MTREHAEFEIQRRLAEISAQFEEVRKIADRYKIEFSFLGGTMHYTDRYDKRVAKTGFFISDKEWKSSSLSCSYDSVYEAWQRANWPEDFDFDDEDGVDE